MGLTISDVRKQLESKFKASSELFPDFSEIKQVEVVPSGVLVLDIITGVGGYPRGRVTEIWGGFSSGKTSLACMAIAAGQAKARKESKEFVALYLDYEHAFDASYARRLGVELGATLFFTTVHRTFDLV